MVGHRSQALILWTAAVAAGQPALEISGRIQPPGEAAVAIHGATTPFSSSTLSDFAGRFRFRGLLPGAYTLSVWRPGSGEARRTVEVGPGTAAGGRVEVEITLVEDARTGSVVSRRDLAIPASARREYRNAERKLGRRDIVGAVAHLEKAVRIEPRFAAAWNHLGTIAYQTREYPRAERHFREALRNDPESFEALVNLGGVLLNLGRPGEALQHNLLAVLKRPSDALANSQLGMSHALSGSLEPARRYLETAKRLDPAHFSHPQLTLAEIYLRQNQAAAAAAELEEFLRLHPDSPDAGLIRERLAKLRQ